jgi:hypothetical protein
MNLRTRFSFLVLTALMVGCGTEMEPPFEDARPTIDQDSAPVVADGGNETSVPVDRDASPEAAPDTSTPVPADVVTQDTAQDVPGDTAEASVDVVDADTDAGDASSPDASVLDVEADVDGGRDAATDVVTDEGSVAVVDAAPEASPDVVPVDATPASVLLSRGRPALLSSCSNGARPDVACNGGSTDEYPASLAFDGVRSNWIQTAQGGDDIAPWVRVDLGSERTITRVNVWNRVGWPVRPLRFAYSNENYVVEVSLDGVVWTRVAENVDPPVYPSTHEVSGAARYVRINLLRMGRLGADDRVLNLAEVEVFGR